MQVLYLTSVGKMSNICIKYAAHIHEDANDIRGNAARLRDAGKNSSARKYFVTDASGKCNVEGVPLRRAEAKTTVFQPG